MIRYNEKQDKKEKNYIALPVSAASPTNNNDSSDNRLQLDLAFNNVKPMEWYFVLD